MNDYERGVANRLKTARGHLNGVLDMVADGAYCPDVMKQLSAVQGLLEGTSRIVLRRHLETCVARAMQEGRTEGIVDELMETLKSTSASFGRVPARWTPHSLRLRRHQRDDRDDLRSRDPLRHCKTSIEGAL